MLSRALAQRCGKGGWAGVHFFPLFLKAAAPLIEETSSMCYYSLCRKCTEMCTCSAHHTWIWEWTSTACQQGKHFATLWLHVVQRANPPGVRLAQPFCYPQIPGINQLFLWKSYPEHGRPEKRKWLLIDKYLNCWTGTNPIRKVILTNVPTAGRSSSALRSRTAQPAGTRLQN